MVNRRCLSYLLNPFLYKQGCSKYDQGICSEKKIPRRTSSKFFTTTMQGQLRMRTNTAFPQLQRECVYQFLDCNSMSKKAWSTGVAYLICLILSCTNRVAANTIKASVQRKRSHAGHLASFSRPRCKVSCGSEPIPFSRSYRANAHISFLIQFDEHAACRLSQ